MFQKIAIAWTSITVIIVFTASHASAAELTTITCTSTAERSAHCVGDTSAGVALQQSIGEAHCLLGRNWGYDAEGVWVSEGCGGHFVLGNSLPVAPGVTAEPAPQAVSASKSDEDGDFSLYTRFGAVTAFEDGEAQVQDNGSRLRFEYATGDRFRFFAVGEWNIALTQSASTISPGESTSSGFVALDRISNNVLGARLGYVGVDFGSAGRLTAGKQWSVHYDIARFTDKFNAFGAEASTTFNGGSDGGFMGTGRADGAVVYRNRFFGRLDVGAQVQLQSLGNGKAVDGYGVSAVLSVLPDLQAGFAYTRARFSESLRAQLLGLDDDGVYRIAGLKYETERLLLSAVYARQRNGDLLRTVLIEDGEPVLVSQSFDANGFEFAGKYKLGRFGLVFGYLNYVPEPDAENIGIDPRIELKYTVAGFDFMPTPRAKMYAEYRFADGYFASGEPGNDVFVIGAKYEFGTKGNYE